LRNSELYHEALLAHGIESTLCVYEDGGHGFGMGEPHQDASRWPVDAEAWLLKIGALPPVMGIAADRLKGKRDS
jgi:hypothetical protein